MKKKREKKAAKKEIIENIKNYSKYRKKKKSITKALANEKDLELLEFYIKTKKIKK